MSFEFLDPGELRDRELELVLVGCKPAARGRVPTYSFELRVAGETVGDIHLRAGTTPNLEYYAGQIGYGVAPAFRGRRYAERATRLVLPLARRHGFVTLWITCNPDNHASRRTCERLGATLVEIVALPTDNEQYLAGEREKCRYRLDL